MIIPTYNQANYIEYTLKSVQKQIYQDWGNVLL
ncbi:glycosyltransferase [Flavobacterium sp.]